MREEVLKKLRLPAAGPRSRGVGRPRLSRCCLMTWRCFVVLFGASVVVASRGKKDWSSEKVQGPEYDADVKAGGVYPRAPESMGSSAEVAEARKAQASNVERLSRIRQRLAEGGEEKLCRGPFPEKGSTRLQWLHASGRRPVGCRGVAFAMASSSVL